MPQGSREPLLHLLREWWASAALLLQFTLMCINYRSIFKIKSGYKYENFKGNWNSSKLQLSTRWPVMIQSSWGPSLHSRCWQLFYRAGLRVPILWYCTSVSKYKNVSGRVVGKRAKYLYTRGQPLCGIYGSVPAGGKTSRMVGCKWAACGWDCRMDCSAGKVLAQH